MNKKVLIIGGVIIAVLVVVLIVIFGGASTTSNMVTEEELEHTISSITCEIDNEQDIEYKTSIFVNDIQFDNEIQNKVYKKIKLNHSKEINSLGVAFIVKPEQDTTFTIELVKNEQVLTTKTLTLKSGQVGNVGLVLKEAVNILPTDEYAIKFSQSENTSFVFDTTLFFFDEV